MTRPSNHAAIKTAPTSVNPIMVAYWMAVSARPIGPEITMATAIGAMPIAMIVVTEDAREHEEVVDARNAAASEPATRQAVSRVDVEQEDKKAGNGAQRVQAPITVVAPRSRILLRAVEVTENGTPLIGFVLHRAST